MSKFLTTLLLIVMMHLTTFSQTLTTNRVLVTDETLGIVGSSNHDDVFIFDLSLVTWIDETKGNTTVYFVTMVVQLEDGRYYIDCNTLGNECEWIVDFTNQTVFAINQNLLFFQEDIDTIED